jgi:hypothetical protein
MRRFVVWTTSKSEYGSGSWAVIDGIVFVRTCNGHKATQLGGSNPEGLARILIRELAQGDGSQLCCLACSSSTRSTWITSAIIFKLYLKCKFSNWRTAVSAASSALNDFGPLGRAYAETDEAEADEATIVEDILTGEYSHPVSVIAFNTVEGWARDVTEDIARAVLTKAQREHRLISIVAQEFLVRTLGVDAPLGG